MRNSCSLLLNTENFSLPMLLHEIKFLDLSLLGSLVLLSSNDFFDMLNVFC